MSSAEFCRVWIILLVALTAAVVGDDVVPCSCGVFLSGQLHKGQQPSGNPVLLYESDRVFPKGPLGYKQCTARCLDSLAQHLHRGADLVCATADRDCEKERAHLLIRNQDASWKSTHLSAGREYCCRDGVSYSCAAPRT